jgi:translation initiation factor 1 (eIF-1/SUI1)
MELQSHSSKQPKRISYLFFVPKEWVETGNLAEDFKDKGSSGCTVKTV